MKKLITLLLLAFTMNMYSQSYTYKETKLKIAESEKHQANGQLSPHNLDLFNEYSKASARYHYSAIGCASISAGLLIGYGCMKDKFELRDGKTKMKENAELIIFGGSAFAALSVILEIWSVKLKTKSNNYLQLHLKGNQAALSYSF